MKTITIAAALVGIAVAGFAAAGLTPQERIAQLEAENALLRKTIELKNAQIEKLKKGLVPAELKPRPQPEPRPATKPAEPKAKFPYVPAKLNKPCGKTEFEWRCLKNSVFQNKEPLILTREFKLLHLEAKPGPEALTVVANVTRRPDIKNAPGDKNWFTVVRVAADHVYREVLRRFGEGKDRMDPFGEYKNLEIRLGIDGKLVAIRDFDSLRLVSETN